jgi:hypothetical protein
MDFTLILVVPARMSVENRLSIDKDFIAQSLVFQADVLKLEKNHHEFAEESSLSDVLLSRW